MQATQNASNRLADRTRNTVAALWARHTAGAITRTEFRALTAAVVAQANTAGVALADVGLAAEITRHLREPTRPLGMLPNDVQVDQDRMGRDIDRLIERAEQGEYDPEDDLGEWAASEPLLTTASSVQTGMGLHGIGRWVRVLSGTSCPLCTGWADGIPRSVETPMARHIGCDCIQQPVF